MGIIVIIVIVIVVLFIVLRGKGNRRKDVKSERLAELKAMSSRPQQPASTQSSSVSLPPQSLYNATPQAQVQSSGSAYQLMAPGQSFVFSSSELISQVMQL